MKRVLPARPSLVQLKHQAKDLRLLAREGASDALATLRRLRRLSALSDEAIAVEPISLSEAQFALALDYGFRSFSELKAHVETARSALAGATAVQRSDGRVIITGFETARWGGGTRRLCSSIATLAIVSERSGDDTDYDYLMGASGAAFRVQMSEGLLCPSSPHATCGFNCAELAVRAWGNEVTYFPTDDAHEAERARAREAIASSVDQGVPVLYEHEESALIVGYTDDALLVRSYAARAPGYQVMEKWPWRVGLASPKARRPEPNAVLEDSLRLATQLFGTAKVGRYTCGRHAYEHWCALLNDERAFEEKTDQEWFSAALGNAHTLESLADARGAAANYLTSMAPHAPLAARSALLDAAAEYGEIERTVRRQRAALAPFPWELPSVRDWSSEARRAERDALAMTAVADGKAIALLQAALSTKA